MYVAVLFDFSWAMNPQASVKTERNLWNKTLKELKATNLWYQFSAAHQKQQPWNRRYCLGPLCGIAWICRL